MPEATHTKNMFLLSGGLNTEANELNFPDGYTTDEANYEVMRDGSRRRRRGLQAETGYGTAKTVETIASTSACTSFVWRNVEGDPTKTFIVTQIGTTLYFADDQETVSQGWNAGQVSILPFSSEATPTTANMRDNKVSMSSGKGHLFVTGPYIKPFYVSWASATDQLSSRVIHISHRDYEGIDDGTAPDTEPTTLLADHRYNLLNRGWGDALLATVASDLSKYPPRTALRARGYVRTYDGSTAAALIQPETGVLSWSSTKFDAEAWGTSPAPQGSLLLNPFDTRYSVGTTGSGPLEIADWQVTIIAGSVWTLAITTTGNHGFTASEVVTIAGNEFVYADSTTPEPGFVTSSWDASHLVVSEDGSTGFTINVAEPALYDSWVTQYSSYGQVSASTTEAVAKSDGALNESGFSAVEFHDGRVFYGGFGVAEYADFIFFSKVAQKHQNYGQCHQEADPTDPDFNALVATDGGFMVLPGMGEVLEMVSHRNSLLIFTRDGVWEVGGGQRGAFSADGYSVRKVTEAGANSASSIAKVDGGVVFTGPGGIYVIAPNQYTGLLEATNTSERSIQTLWNQIPILEQENMVSVYDESLKRLYFMYGATTSDNTHDTMLIFDANSGAYFKYTFTIATSNFGLLTGFAISNADDTSSNKKVKFIYQDGSTTAIQIADFDQTTYLDVDAVAGPAPYMVTGWDNIGDFQTRRQAPVITVYQKKTETGYTADGSGGLTPDNPSSCTMQAYWDWTDHANSGKIATAQQVYRHSRAYQPTGAGDNFDDGYPVVVTRNKVRGRGRVLALKFQGTTIADSHILGFTTNYAIKRGAP